MTRQTKRNLKKYGTYILVTVIPTLAAILAILDYTEKKITERDKKIAEQNEQLVEERKQNAALKRTIKSMQEADSSKHEALREYVIALNGQIINIKNALRSLFEKKHISSQNYAKLENNLKEISENSEEISQILRACQVANKKLNVSNASTVWLNIERTREDAGIRFVAGTLQNKFVILNAAVSHIENGPPASENDFKKIKSSIKGCLTALRDIENALMSYKEVNNPQATNNLNYALASAGSPSSLSGWPDFDQAISTASYFILKDERDDFARDKQPANQFRGEKIVAPNHPITSLVASSTDFANRNTSPGDDADKAELALKETPKVSEQNENNRAALQSSAILTELERETAKDSAAVAEKLVAELNEREKVQEYSIRQKKESEKLTRTRVYTQAVFEMLRIEEEARQAKKN